MIGDAGVFGVEGCFVSALPALHPSGGGRFSRGRMNRQPHAVLVVQGVVIPNAQNAIALRFKDRGSARIVLCVFRLAVVNAVHFDDQSRRMRNDI